MSHPLVRARWLAPALLLALTAGCSAPKAQARLEARAAAVDPPALWRVQSLDAAGAPSATLFVCADEAVRAGFLRADAEADGRPCLRMKGWVDREGLYAARCSLDGRRFGLTATRSGDPDRAFTIAFALKALDGTNGQVRQVRRFQRLGACPAGWGIGDQARAGGPRGVNALAGTWSGA